MARIVCGCVLALFVLHIGAMSLKPIKTSSPLGSRISQEQCLSIRPRSDSINNTQREGRRAGDADESALAMLYNGEIQFSINLFKTMYNLAVKTDHKSNLFISPISVYSALLLTYFGANGSTEKQLANILGLSDTDKVGVIQAYKMNKFTRELMKLAGLVKYEFELANRLYFDENVNLRDCMQSIFTDEIQTANFTFQAEETRQSINKWVEGLTRSKVQNLLTPDTITSQTRMALVNAAYFKGKWVSQFNNTNTKLNPFAINTKDMGMAHMMFQKGYYKHAISEELGAELLEMPFMGNDVGFFVLLPASLEGGLDATVQNLQPVPLRAAMDRLIPISLEVGIPKFRMEQLTNLRYILRKMNLEELFNPSQADLSGFNGQKSLYVSTAIHKAFIEVNEEGSEAAAATALVDLRMARPLGPTQFICDHPFLFFIFDHLSESILFMGAYRNPK